MNEDGIWTWTGDGNGNGSGNQSGNGSGNQNGSGSGNGSGNGVGTNNINSQDVLPETGKESTIVIIPSIMLIITSIFAYIKLREMKGV